MKTQKMGRDILFQVDENSTEYRDSKTDVPTRIDHKREAKNIPLQKVAPAKQASKERITVQISKGTIERVKDCVYWNRLTVARFVEEALENALRIAENENGKPFQKRRSDLKPGRPIK